MISERAVERIWAGDGSYWRPEALARKQIEASLGWLTLPERMVETVPDLEKLAAAIRTEADRVVVVGSGGAALAPWALAGTVEPAEGFPALAVLDTTEPSAVTAAVGAFDPARTVFVIASRTGAGLETNLLFDVLFGNAARTLGEVPAGQRFLAVTEPGSALATEAGKRRVRAVIPADPRTPALFGALSPFGLVPAALAGRKIREVLDRAGRMAEACRAPGAENPGLLLGAALGAEAAAGRDKLTLSAAREAGGLARWLEALVGSATGHDGKGIVPIEGEPLGAPDVYGSDRVFARFEMAGAPDAAADRRLATLVEHGHPLLGFVLRDELDLGAEIYRWQFASAVAGRLLAVNPFDESDQADVRNRASRMLAGGAIEPAAAAASADGGFPRLLASIQPGDYFAISAYVPESPAAAEALEALRLAVRDSKRVATIAGFGPRVQHAAGQVQKGGPPRGAFLQLTASSAADLAIPARPWGFQTVFAAQADAELEALVARGRRAVRVRLETDPGQAIAGLTALVAREAAA